MMTGYPLLLDVHRTPRPRRRRWAGRRRVACAACWTPAQTSHVVAPVRLRGRVGSRRDRRPDPAPARVRRVRPRRARGSCTPRPVTAHVDDRVAAAAEHRHLWCVRADDARGRHRVDAGGGAGRRRRGRGQRRRPTPVGPLGCATPSPLSPGHRRAAAAPARRAATRTRRPRRRRPRRPRPHHHPRSHGCSPRPTSSSSTGSRRAPCSTTSTPTSR